jgi:hypothetical protein
LGCVRSLVRIQSSRPFLTTMTAATFGSRSCLCSLGKPSDEYEVVTRTVSAQPLAAVRRRVAGGLFVEMIAEHRSGEDRSSLQEVKVDVLFILRRSCRQRLELL